MPPSDSSPSSTAGAALPAGLARAVARGLLACPLCRERLAPRGRSLVCARGHCFDVARQGHVNLAPAAAARAAGGGGSGYDRALMQSRAAVAAAGFFDAAIAACRAIIAAQLPSPPGAVLDAGCGEGSFLSRLTPQAGLPTEAAAVGLDLAAEGIRIAAARSKQEAWCVADLAAIPAPDHVFDLVLNVLAPANYAEFHRVLRASGDSGGGGLVVKAIPTPNHLRELRQALGRGDGHYSNEPVAEHFRAAFPSGGSELAESSFACADPSTAAALLSMTPLGWHATPDQRRAFAESPPAAVTVSLELLWGSNAP